MKKTPLGVEIPVQPNHRRNTINKLARTEVPRPSYGPGFYRMADRLGAEQMETMRLDTVAQQEAMRAKVTGEDVPVRDRTSYKDYPTPKKSKRRK